MKLATIETEVERIGMGAESDFKIKATAKAFRILSSGLYKDKIAAILRELSANAWDAHVAIGKTDTAFDVHLPNMLEPYLAIRDYGPGISHDDVINLYTTYFESSKTDSNDYIGALGLGSKSPFSYTRSFTVISRQNGVTRTYDAFIGDIGVPSIALRSQQDEDAPDGLEIIVPVPNAADFSEFSRKAANTYEYYPVKPNVIGQSDFTFREVKLEFDGDGYRLMQRGRNFAMAVMGVVGYPIDTNALFAAAKQDDAVKKFWTEETVIKSILTSSIDIDFAIGELDITAGREDLSYDPDTVRVLMARLYNIATNIRKTVMEEFKSCSSIREARQTYARLFGTFYSPMTRILGQKYTVDYKGTAIESQVLTVDLANFQTLTLHIYQGYGHKIDTRKYVKPTPPFRVIKNEICIVDSTDFYIRDMDGNFGSRVKRHRKLKSTPTTTILIHSEDKDELKRFCALLDGYEIGKVSELERVPFAERTRAKVKQLRMSKLCFEIHSPNHRNSDWEDEEILIADGGLYAITKHNKFEFASHIENGMSRALIAARNLNIITENTPIFAIPATESSPFLKHENWRPLEDYLVEKIQALKETKPEHVASAIRCKAYAALMEYDHRDFWNKVVDSSEIDERHPIKETRAIIGEIIFSKLNSFGELAYTLGLDFTSPLLEAKYDAVGKLKSLYEQYPLMELITTEHKYSSVLHRERGGYLLHYITMVDQHKEMAARLQKDI